ncbi:MAG: YdcF family protein [Clostridia bacterium]|nr:YdcF family protein [Clostridia bacterium]
MLKNKKVLIAGLLTFITLAVAVAGINIYIIASQHKKIISRDEASRLTDVDYVVVLGCGIRGDKPTHMLEDRLLEGIAVADLNKDCKLLLTGDNSGVSYNEVAVMKNFCLEKGFDESRIVTDDFGFSTGESIENVNNKFEGNKIIIITQVYHTFRALFIAESLDMDAYAVPSSPRKYSTWLYNNTREPLARVKDFIKYF